MTRRSTLTQGSVFGLLTVTKILSAAKCICKCDCGTEREYWRGNLLNGQSSCGCVKRQGRVNPTCELAKVWR